MAEAIDSFCRTTEVMDASGRKHRRRAHRRRHGEAGRPPTRRRRPMTTTTGPSARPGRGARGRSSSRRWRILKGFDIGEHGPRRARSSSTLVTEAMKLAFADREAYYGDPDFVDVPMDALLSEALLRRAPQAHRRHGVAASSRRRACRATRRRWTRRCQALASIAKPTVG